MAKCQFNILADVEVVGSDSGLKGSYYTATVTAYKGNGEFVKVSYGHLKDRYGNRLIDTVHSSLLRPVPVDINRASYEIGDHVNYKARNGWWYGTIAAKKGGDRYTVEFSDFEYLSVDCGVSELRLHQHWDGVNFVPSRS